MKREYHRKRDLFPEMMYGANIAGRAALGAGLGYLAKKGAGGLGYALDKFHSDVIPRAAEADEKIGTITVEQGGDIGEAVIAVDQAQGNLWSKIFGRTPEEQQEWREKHNIEDPSYLSKEGTTVTIEMAPRSASEPTTYQQKFNEMADPLVVLGLLAGGAYGFLRGGATYVRDCLRRRYDQRQTREREDLSKRIAVLEERLRQPGDAQ